MMFVDERLRQVVEKLVDLQDDDIRELDVFVDYLLHGPEKLPPRREKESARIYDFMNGGLEGRPERDK